MAKKIISIPLEEIDFNKYLNKDTTNIFQSGLVEYLRLDSTFPNSKESNKNILFHILKCYPDIYHVMIARDLEVALYSKISDDFDRIF